MTFSKNAEYLLKKRYCRRGESIAKLFERVAGALSNGDFNLGIQLKKAMTEGYFLPASPTIRNAGIKKALMHPCHVLPISDSIESIMSCLSNAATVFHHGGGVGFNASTLRPKGTNLSLGGTSSGVVSFLKLFDDLTDVVKQGGFRRGALMGVLNHDHPEIASFITSKLTGNLTNFNISILVNDDFMMKATMNNKSKIKLKFGKKTYESVHANDLFDQIVFSAYICGDPGLLFYDRINEDNSMYPDIEITATNPCVTGDTKVLTEYGHIPIEALIGETVDIWNGTEWSSVTPFSTGMNNLLEVNLSNGVTLNCTNYHKFILDDYSRIEAKDLKIGDALARFDLPILDGMDTPKGDAYSQGFYSGDGNTGLRKSRVYSTKFCCMSRLKGNIGALGTSNTKDDIRYWYHGDMLAKNFVPINASVYYKLNWLAGLCDTDGTMSSNSIQITSVDKDFLLNVRLLLTTLGEETTVSMSHKERIKNIKGKDYKCKACYRLIIAHSQVDNLRKLGFKCDRLESPTYEATRSSKRFVTIKSIYRIEGEEETFCFNESKKNLGTFNGVVISNCGEVPLPPMTSCNLGSINLTKFVSKNGSFDFKEYSKYVEISMRALKNVNKIAWYPFPDMTENMRSMDICGLGHFGLADAFIMMGIYYDSKEAIEFLSQLSKPYVEITDAIGGDSYYKRSQAPTGSLSIIADCSAGIEPVFERSFERHLTVGVMQEVRELYQSKYCRTAHEIDPIDHLKIQSKIQSFTDAGVSKTINLPHDATMDDIRKIYIRAWKMRCKGITVFRDQSKEGVLKKVSCSDENCYL